MTSLPFPQVPEFVEKWPERDAGLLRVELGKAAFAQMMRPTDDRLLAAQIPHITSSNIAVEVELPADDPDSDRNSFCNVGRMAEVRFQRTGLGFAEWIVKALPWLTGGKDRSEVALNSAARK